MLFSLVFSWDFFLFLNACFQKIGVCFDYKLIHCQLFVSIFFRCDADTCMSIIHLCPQVGWFLWMSAFSYACLLYTVLHSMGWLLVAVLRVLEWAWKWCSNDFCLLCLSFLAPGLLACLCFLPCTLLVKWVLSYVFGHHYN